MRRLAMLLSGAALMLGTSAPDAQAGDLHLRLGAFFPRADTGAPNDLFGDVNELYTRDAFTFEGVKASDWIGVHGGVEYSLKLAERFEVGFHVDGYGRTLDTFYRDYTDEVDREIFQTLKLTIVPSGVTFRFVTGSRSSIQPYLGGGVDAVWYRYEEFGDFIDFSDPGPGAPPIIPDSFLDEGWAFGLHAVGGLRIAINYDFAIVAEGRYMWSETAMGRDFRLNRIDLGGASATLGVLVRF